MLLYRSIKDDDDAGHGPNKLPGILVVVVATAVVVMIGLALLQIARQLCDCKTRANNDMVLMVGGGSML